MKAIKLCRQTQIAIISALLLFGGFSVVDARSGWAGEFESAQGNLSKSYNDMYKALKQSPNPRADGASLYQQKVVPAQAEVSRATKAQSQETGKKLDAQWKAEQADQARTKSAKH